MPNPSKWPNEPMWTRAVELKKSGLSYTTIPGRLASEFSLEEVPSADTTRRQILQRIDLDAPSGVVNDGILYVDEPRSGWWDHIGGPDSAFFITFEVRTGAQSVPNCRALISIEDEDGPSFPLHWAGHSYSMIESDPDYISITPGIPARLDVAFSPEVFEAGSTVDRVAYDQTHIGDAGLARLRGLTDWDGKGCWIAQPYALSQPRPGMTAFMPPGEYLVRIKMYGRGDTLAFEEVYLLTSPERPEDLDLKIQRSTTVQS